MCDTILLEIYIFNFHQLLPHLNYYPFLSLFFCSDVTNKNIYNLSTQVLQAIDQINQNH